MRRTLCTYLAHVAEIKHCIMTALNCTSELLTTVDWPACQCWVCEHWWDFVYEPDIWVISHTIIPFTLMIVTQNVWLVTTLVYLFEVWETTTLTMKGSCKDLETLPGILIVDGGLGLLGALLGAYFIRVVRFPYLLQTPFWQHKWVWLRYIVLVLALELMNRIVWAQPDGTHVAGPGMFNLSVMLAVFLSLQLTMHLALYYGTNDFARFWHERVGHYVFVYALYTAIVLSFLLALMTSNLWHGYYSYLIMHGVALVWFIVIYLIDYLDVNDYYCPPHCPSPSLPSPSPQACARSNLVDGHARGRQSTSRQSLRGLSSKFLLHSTTAQ